jgi:glycosyltransferase involved in cell wall biosynthesis
MLFAKALIQAGFEIQIISFKRQYPHWLYPGKSDRDPSQTALQVDAAFTLDPINPWTCWQSYNQIKTFSPDLVIFQWWTTFWAPAYLILIELLRSKRYPIAFLIHNVLPHENKIFDKLLARMVLSRGDFFVLLTKREQIRLFNLFNAKNSFVCKYPANTMLNNQRKDKTEARIKLNLPKEKFILLFFGLVRPYKGLNLLIDAVGQLHHDGDTTFLAIAGEFWEDPQKYNEQIDRLNLKSAVRIENRYLPDEELALWMSAADIYVAPYISGTQSGTIRLAMGYDLPIIATEAIAAEFDENEYSNIKIVPTGDSLAIADAIREWHMNTPPPFDLSDHQDSWEETIKVVSQIIEQNRG